MEIHLSRSTAASLETALLIVPLAEGQALTDHPNLAALDALSGGALGRGIASGDFNGRTTDRVLGYASANGGSHTDGLSADGGSPTGDGPSAESRSSTGDGPSAEGGPSTVDGPSPKGSPVRILLLGVGPHSDLDSNALRNFAGRAIREAEALRVTDLGLVLDHLDHDPRTAGQAVAEGLVLGAWRFDEGQEVDESKSPLVTSGTLIVSKEEAWDEGVRRGDAFARGENLARSLQSRPGNVATPTHLGEVAESIAEETGIECQIMGPAEIVEEGMEALLSVSAGSDQEPRFIVLKYSGGPSDQHPVVLVGKGLTFDAGGISIKPAKGMEEMKFDMSGGAAVLGAMYGIGLASPPINVTALVPSSENLLNGSANKPGDVIGSRSGKTIEVINTDAEGRLILCDALSYALDLSPAAIVDCATLTGACVVALGAHRSGLFSNDDALAKEILDCGDAVDEPCWRLPVGPEYRKQLDSPYADLKNVGGRDGGSITAACFLQEFVGDVPWAHLDIAGSSYGERDRPYLRKGAFGIPSRLLQDWVWKRAEQA